MPIVILIRLISAIFSLAILAAAAILLWDWYQGDWWRDSGGVLRRDRDEWKLWVGAALLAWSLLGRFPVRLLLARRDADPLRPERIGGRTIASETGAEIYLEDHGSPMATPVILTHGWSLDSSIWHYAKRDLGAHFRVIAWDLPGLGRSRRADPEICLSDFARDLRSVVAQVGDQRPLLVGHSIGGMVIQTLARDDPEWFRQRVAGVLLFNTTWTNPLKTMVLGGLLQALRKPLLIPMLTLMIWLSPLVGLIGWQSYLSGWMHLGVRFGFGRFVTRSQLDHTALLITRASPAVSAHGDLAMLRWDGSAGAAQLDAPALVIGGGIDIVTKAEASREIAARAPRARVEIVEGANHMGPVERAELYNAAIRRLADEVRNGESVPAAGGLAVSGERMS